MRKAELYQLIKDLDQLAIQRVQAHVGEVCFTMENFTDKEESEFKEDLNQLQEELDELGAQMTQEIVAEIIAASGDVAESDKGDRTFDNRRRLAFRRLAAIDERIRAGGDPNRRGLWGDTLLMNALADSHEETEERTLEVMRSLLERGAEVDARDEDGRTALFRARNATMQLLLDRGANPNAIASNGETPLIEAVKRGALSDVNMLLAYGAKCSNWPIKRCSAMQIALEYEQFDIVERFLKHGANVAEVDFGGQGLLHLVQIASYLSVCAESTRIEMAKLLIEYGAAGSLVDFGGRTALHVAAIEGRSKEMMLLLLANGARLNAVDYQGNTAWDCAQDYGTEASAEILAGLAHESGGSKQFNE